MDEKPRRRRFGFTRRLLLVAALIASLPLAWVAYSLHWISERNAIRRRQDVSVRGKFSWPPGGLWLFGEPFAHFVTVEEDSPITNERLEELFPEANVKRVSKSVWQFNAALERAKRGP
jgi:hypothetical protein